MSMSDKIRRDFEKCYCCAHQTSRRRAFSKIHQSATEIVCVCLSQVCKTPMLYIILKLRF